MVRTAVFGQSFRSCTISKNSSGEPSLRAQRPQDERQPQQFPQFPATSTARPCSGRPGSGARPVAGRGILRIDQQAAEDRIVTRERLWVRWIDLRIDLEIDLPWAQSCQACEGPSDAFSMLFQHIEAEPLGVFSGLCQTSDSTLGLLNSGQTTA